MPRELLLLLDRIHDLSIEHGADPPQPLLAVIEHTLTDGYAVALALEGESARLQRRIAELAARIENGEQAAEMRLLGDRLAEANGDLAGLRASLAALRRRAEAVRVRVAATPNAA
jgi:hypothetical protein